MGIPSKWGYHPLLVGGKNSWISGLEVCMAADSPLANPQDLSTQIIRAADEVSWHQWDGEGVPTRAVHPESVAFPTENQRNSLHFFFEVRSIWRFAGIGLLEPQIFFPILVIEAVQRRVQWVQKKWQVFAVIFIAEMVIKLIALGLIWGPGALTCPDRPWR